MEIENFYPKFPDIRELTSELNPYRTRFNDDIVSKKEFASQKLDRVDAPITIKGDYYNHQIYISRFMSSLTGYDELLLFHEPGTGKSCTAIAAIEKLRYEKDSFVKGALIFAKGASLLNNFKQELIFNCTDGRYIPEDYNQLTEGERTRRINKNSAEFYQFHTFEKFATEISNLSDGQLRNQFENTIMVLDEVHDMREKAVEEIEEDSENVFPGKNVNIYHEFHRLCHVLQKRKILIMSGTPMKDGPEEFASVMNLILPLELQFETEKAFIKKYFTPNHVFIPARFDEFTTKIRGRVSYLKAAKSLVLKQFIGKPIGKLRHFLIYETTMSNFQTRHYQEAYQKDAETKSIYNESRQASLFIFPDGTTGSEGFAKYMTKQFGGFSAQKQKQYAPSRELIEHVSTLDSLTKYSSKYATAIELILNDPKGTFVYCQFVFGSGAILFAAILEQYGFQRANGTEKTIQKRYALITHQTMTIKEIQTTINKFNEPSNVDGKYIAVIIGSRVLMQGLTLKNIRREIILTGHWNMSETDQAIARGWRIGSHDEMINKGYTNISVKIYQLISKPNRNIPCIDLEMYETAETKDVVIKQIERIVKISSFDCPLTINRNKILGYDNQRDCEYDSCQYVCDGSISNVLDSSTYIINLQIQTQVLNRIDREFKRWFRTNFFYSLKDVTKTFPELQKFEIVQAIKTLIDSDEIYVNKFGFPCFLDIQGNVLYITMDPKIFFSVNVENVALSDYFVRNFLISTRESFSTILEKTYNQQIPLIIQNIFNFPKYAQEILTTLSFEIQREILQGCLLAEHLNIEKNVATRRMILDFYKGFYEQTIKDGETSWIVSLYSDDLDSTIYNPITHSFEPYVVESEKINVRKDELKASPVGYYGLYNPKLKDFCLKIIETLPQKTDLRKITVGRRCINFEQNVVLDLIVRKIKRDPPTNYLERESLVQLQNIAKHIKLMKPEDLTDRNQLRRLIYWNKETRQNICKNIQQWFEENNLMEENFDCGTQKKKRAKFV